MSQAKLVETLEREFIDFRDQLSSYILRLTGNYEDTKDILQESYYKALKNLDHYQGRSPIKSWVFSIATNLVRDHFRGRERWHTVTPDLAKEDADDNPSLIQRYLDVYSTDSGAFEIKEHIDFCFTCMAKTLPVEQQIALILKDIYQFKQHEIMLIMNLSEGKVKHAIANARATMTTIFEKKCALINKNGACHQCSELNGILNPKQKRQSELMKIKMYEESKKGKSSKHLYKLRTALIRQIDPLNNNSTNLHNYFLSLMPHYSKNSNLEHIDE